MSTSAKAGPGLLPTADDSPICSSTLISTSPVTSPTGTHTSMDSSPTSSDTTQKTEFIMIAKQLDQYHKKCICQICTCSKHRCPQPRARLDYISSYRQHFAPSNPVFQDAKALQLKGHPNNQNPQIFRIPFQGVSAYKQYFSSNAAKLAKPLEKPTFSDNPFPALQPSVIVPTKFQGESSYRRDFQERRVQAALPKVRSQRTLNPNVRQQKMNCLRNKLYPEVQASFDGVTSYRDHYQQYLTPLRSLKRTILNYVPPLGKFQGQSSYKQDFRLHPLECKGRERCPCEQLRAPYVNQSKQLHLHFNREEMRFQ